jgi:UDP-glucose 4-epimerase
VRALLALLDLASETAGEIYNIGSNHEVTINDLAHQVLDHTESASQITHIPYSEAYAPGFEDMRRRVPDTAKISEATGWEATLDLSHIIEDVIEHETRRFHA